MASVYIPPRRYEEVETGETDDDDEEDNTPVMSREAVLVTLWTIPFNDKESIP